MNQNDTFELVAIEDLTVEELPDGDALAGCFACAGSASTASCPGSSAATASSASTIS
ncbi:thiocillin family RiPP [Cryptosporangium minutisporangium]|uniref:Thiocillin family RiPP n=1 Tax=Cryptosporangium minutisporangium TaxID=113569 RepID=A0ABP6T0X8_9ACTN